jgi:hypothetical protein
MLTSQQIIKESAGLAPRNYANLFSDLPDNPIQKVTALSHYRLIFESCENASVTTFLESRPITLPGIQQVKIFEFVRGAQIHGEGSIEVPILTNTGRVFVYRQESTQGLFTVPYSTEGNPYGVRATGPYHIAGTSQYFNVSEADVIQGNLVKGYPLDRTRAHVITHTLIADRGEHFTAHEKSQTSGHHPVIRHGQYPF